MIKRLLNFLLLQFFLGIASGTTAFPASPFGPPPYLYQWRKDGVPIPGATSLEYIAEEAGNYDLVVTNGEGIVITTTDALGLYLKYRATAPRVYDQSLYPHNDGSYVPWTGGGESGGTVMYCIAGVTNWQTGPIGQSLDFGDGWQLWVGTKCAFGYVGNVIDPIQGEMMVNPVPAQLSTYNRPDLGR